MRPSHAFASRETTAGSVVVVNLRSERFITVASRDVTGARHERRRVSRALPLPTLSVVVVVVPSRSSVDLDASVDGSAKREAREEPDRARDGGEPGADQRHVREVHS